MVETRERFKSLQKKMEREKISGYVREVWRSGLWVRSVRLRMRKVTKERFMFEMEGKDFFFFFY